MSTRLIRRSAGRRQLDEAGMTSAEYAVGTAAAVAFAMVLLAVAQNSSIFDLILHVFSSALQLGLGK